MLSSTLADNFIRLYRFAEIKYWRIVGPEVKKWNSAFLTSYGRIGPSLAAKLSVYYFFILLLRFPIIFLMHCFSPFREIRLSVLTGKGMLSNEIHYLEPYLRTLSITDGGEKIFAIIIYHQIPSNQALLDKYREACVIIGVEHPIFRRVLHFVHDTLTSTRFHVDLRKEFGGEWWKSNQVWDNAPPIVSLSPKDNLHGQNILSQLGIPKDSSIVCIATPQVDYYERKEVRMKLNVSNINSGWGDVKFKTAVIGSSSGFNSINNFFPAAEYLRSNNIYVINMGLNQDRRLDPDGLIIDYPSLCRSEMGDLYLMSQSKFLICSSTGLFKLAAAMNIPCVFTDNVNAGDGPPQQTGLTIPMKYLHVKNSQPLTLQELIDIRWMEVVRAASTPEDSGICVVNNTSEEILDVVREMNERLDGIYKPQAGDSELQEKYRSSVAKSLFSSKSESPMTGYRLKIGAKYLRDNQHLST